METLTIKRFGLAGLVVGALAISCSGKKTEQEPPAPAGSAGAAKAGAGPAASSGRE